MECNKSHYRERHSGVNNGGEEDDDNDEDGIQ
jgi:hypothetical protein